MVNIATLSKSINVMLVTMDEELALTEKAMGLHPDIDAARLHAVNLDKALNQLGELIMRAQWRNVMQPPDVIERVNRCHARLMQLFQEIVVCGALLLRNDMPGHADRSRSSIPKATLPKDLN